MKLLYVKKKREMNKKSEFWTRKLCILIDLGKYGII